MIRNIQNCHRFISWFISNKKKVLVFAKIPNSVAKFIVRIERKETAENWIKQKFQASVTIVWTYFYVKNPIQSNFLRNFREQKKAKQNKEKFRSLCDLKEKTRKNKSELNTNKRGKATWKLRTLSFFHWKFVILCYKVAEISFVTVLTENVVTFIRIFRTHAYRTLQIVSV